MGKVHPEPVNHGSKTSLRFMNPSLKAVLAAVLIFSLGALAASWVADLNPGLVWPLRIGGGSLAGVALGLLIRAELRKDQVPEFLIRQFGGCYESSGFCFVVCPEDEAGHSMLRVYFQNRYANRCEAVVRIQHIRWRLRVPDVPACQIRIDCPGAAYGYTGIAWPIPLNWQGKTILLGLSAASRYPEGKGDLLRFREGTYVGSIRAASWDTFFTLSKVLTGDLGFSNQARIKVLLPQGVSESAPKNHTVTTEIIWPTA